MLGRFTAVADSFVPKIATTREDLFKARLIIYPNLCAAFIVATILAAMAVSGTLLSLQALSYLTLMLLHGSVLFVLRRSRDIEWVGIIFLCLLALKTTIETIYLARSPINSGIQNFPLYVVFGFFVSSSLIKRGVLVACMTVLTLSTFFLLKDSGFSSPFDQDSQTLIKNASIPISLRSLLVLVSVYWFVQIRNTADEELEREVEWQLQGEKLNEISKMMGPLFPRLEPPVKKIGTLLDSPSIEVAPDPTLTTIRTEVSEIKSVIQNIGWIYRAYRNEHVRPTPQNLILRQLEDLLGNRYGPAGWSIKTAWGIESKTIQGPLPSFLLLVMTIADHVVANTPSLDSRVITIECRSQGHRAFWDIAWPSTTLGIDGLKNHPLVDELLENVEGSLESFRRESLQGFRISSPFLSGESLS